MGQTGNTRGVVKGEVRPEASAAEQANPSVFQKAWDGVKREIPGVGAYYHGQDAIDAFQQGDYWGAAGSSYEAVENLLPMGKGVKLVRLGIKEGFKRFFKKEARDEAKKDTKKDAKEDAGGAVKKPCKVDSHRVMKELCKLEGAHSHHIIPREFAKQVGVSDDDGPAVCVPSSFHNKFVHPALNAEIADASDYGEIRMGTLMGFAIPIAAKGATQKGCLRAITAATVAKFGPHADKMVQTKF